ncbi:S-adenosylmethionine synthase [bacterium HR17]|jgi:S-adenosylmethionine synthetase|uniref:S-adenosylmethionine synthase n=1 Tax=Candidatus Fervidibacter japonicus TaxID=2035412 RepID=A0A2H5X973_9BACT|nr:S-adenosylmethionine synthase [bacterium HR17]
MTARLQVANGMTPFVEQMPVEIVERKGKGHPDSLCDGAAEELSVALCEFYRREVGAILHHNVDKAVLVGGVAEAHFGGGHIVEPIQVDIVGRATLAWDSRHIDPDRAFADRIVRWLCQQVRHLQPDQVQVRFRIRRGSTDLQAIFRDDDMPPLANDTSFAVGFAPLSELERLVLETERFLNSDAGKQRFPQLGEDIKVMGVRNDDTIRLTIAAAFVAALTPDRAVYETVKRQVAAFVQNELAPQITRRKVEVFVNTADTEGSAYITVTGTSAENGDDGQVGRGNRANGLITPYRPMTLEAVAGKNPVSHVGKVYSIMTHLIAHRIAEQIPEVQQVYCYMVSQIGQPITDPQVVHVEVWGVPAHRIRTEVAHIVDEVLGSWRDIRDGFVARRWRIY